MIKKVIKPINYAHINIFHKKGDSFKIWMEFLWPILAKIELICQQPAMSQWGGVQGGKPASSGVLERMAEPSQGVLDVCVIWDHVIMDLTCSRLTTNLKEIIEVPLCVQRLHLCKHQVMGRCCLYIKITSYRYGNSHYKDKMLMVLPTTLIVLKWGLAIPDKQVLLIRY